MADQSTDPHDDQVESVPLPTDDGGEEFPPMKDLLDSDPVAAGAGSVPADDGGHDPAPTKFS